MGYIRSYYLQHKDEILKYNRPYSLESYFKRRFGGKREIILKRDLFSCRKCGMSQKKHIEKFNRDITIDHVDKDKLNNSKSNLITLCLKYHNSKDRRLTADNKKNALKNKILFVLSSQPLSARKIGLKVGITHTPAMKYLLELHSEGKVLQVPYLTRKYWKKKVKI